MMRLRLVAALAVFVAAGCTPATTEGLSLYELDRDGVPATQSLLGAVAPEGRIQLRADCVVLEGQSAAWTLAFPEGSARTDDEVRVLTVVGDSVTVADGQAVALAGGGLEESPGGPLPAAPEGCPAEVRRVIDLQVFD